MAYIGVQPADAYTSFAVQHFTTSATTSYTLDNPVANENEIALFINNVRQEPGSSYAYTASGTSLTLSAATSASDTMYCVFIGKAVQTVTVPAGSLIDLNGQSDKLVLDADGDTTISADTDDTIDIKVGGTDVTKINSTGQHLQTPLGVSVPSYSFTNDTDTGMTRPTTNTLQFVAGGTEVYRVTSAGLHIGGTGSANALDDYEEGTFTATLKGQTEPATLVTTTGFYAKVGRQVSFQIDFNGVDTTGYSGAVDVYGLPFANSSSGRAMCSVGTYRMFSFDSASYVTGEIGTNNTIVTPQQMRSANSWTHCSHNAGSDRYIWVTGTYQTN